MSKIQRSILAAFAAFAVCINLVAWVRDSPNQMQIMVLGWFLVLAVFVLLKHKKG